MGYVSFYPDWVILPGRTGRVCRRSEYGDDGGDHIVRWALHRIADGEDGLA
jgi:hypothetical protein